MSYLHVDLNSFYAYCTVITSDGRYTFDSPIIIGGDESKRHGIVLAATYPVKKKGIHAGMSLREAMALFPEAELVPADYSLYTHYSNKFMDIVKQYSPLIMRYGIDEAYIDYNGCEYLFGPPVEIAYTIKERVKNEIGLTVSVGVGDNPLMAKMGSDYKKPDAVTVVTRDFWREHILPLKVSDLMYIGRSTTLKLNSIGIFTIGQLATASQSVLKAMFGVAGKQMWLHANGIDDQKVLLESDDQKSISCACTLPGDIECIDELYTAILRQTDKVSFKLRQLGMRALVIGVTVKYNDLSHLSKQYKMFSPSDVTGELYDHAKRLVASLYGAKPIRQVGVRVASLVHGREQLTIFEDKLHEKRHKLDCALDELRTRYGNDVISRGSTLCYEAHDTEDLVPFDRQGAKK